MASDPVVRVSASAGCCRRAGWAMATGHPAPAGFPPTAIWPPKSTIHGSPPPEASTSRRRASPLPNAPASRVTSAVRVTRQVSASNRKCSKPVAARTARRTPGAGTEPPARRPHASTSRPTAGSNAPPVRRCQRANRGHRPHSAGGSRNGSPAGCRLRAPRTLSARHVLSDASVRSITPTIRSSVCSPAERSAACTTRVAHVPIRWTVRSTWIGATAGVCRASAKPAIRHGASAVVGAVPPHARQIAAATVAALMGRAGRPGGRCRDAWPAGDRAASPRPCAWCSRRRRRRSRRRGSRSTP